MGIEFVDQEGSFLLKDADRNSGLYFPLTNEGRIMGSVTPDYHGDIKTDQDHFFMEPVSVENLHSSMVGRNFWCRIENGRAWSATGESAWQQMKAEDGSGDDVSLLAGKLWQFTRRKNQTIGIVANVLSFCPATKEQVELMRVTITNTGNHALVVTPIAAIPIYGRSADNMRDHRHVTSLLTRTKIVENGICVKPTLSFDERGHQENAVTYGVYGACDDGSGPIGFYPVIGDFIGEGGNLYWPEAVQSGKKEAYVTQGEFEGYEAMGGLRFETITLQKGESKTYRIVLSYNGEGQAYLEPEKMEAASHAIKYFWRDQEIIACKSEDEQFDRWMSWVSIQPTLRRLYGCSFLPHHDYGRGGRGWRDLWQDSLALILLSPENVRGNLVSYFGGVRMDGTNATIIGSKPGEFKADRNAIVRVWMDHGVWPLITTNFYIEQTGDIAILMEECSYFQENAHQDKYHGSVLEHLLLQHLTAFYDAGMHGHIRLRDADWNDGLDMAAEYGESVAFTAAYSGNMLMLAEMIGKLRHIYNLQEIFLAKEMEILWSQPTLHYQSVGCRNKILQQYRKLVSESPGGEKISVSLKTLEADLRSKAEWLQMNIRKRELVNDADDNHWFNSYYDNHSRQVEGVIEGHVRMMLTGQVFAIMSGTASDKHIAAITRAADTYLYAPHMGGYRLNTNFHEVKMDMGRMFGFAYGHKENGAVFCHMAVMYAYSLYQKGFVKEGYKALHALYSQGMDFDVSHIYPGIPEYYDERGRGCYHYLTGAASWYVLTVLTQMYGVRGQFGNLLLQPKLLAKQFDPQGSATITCRFAGRVLNIVYLNEHHKEIGDYAIEEVYIDDVMYEMQDRESVSIKRSDIEKLHEDSEHVIRVILN